MTKPSISRSRPSAAAESSSGKRRPSNNDDSSFPSLYNPEDTTNTNSTKPANQTKNQRAPLKKNSNNRSHNRRKGSTSSEESSGSIEFDQEDSDDDNDGDDAEEDDAEEDEPSVFAPSYGNRLKRRRKAGLSSSPSQLRKEKRVKIKQSELESDDEGSIGSACSVSSVSSISIDGSVSGDSDAEYEGVDYVSDGDDEDVEKLEEELILDEFERGPASTVVPGPRGLGDEWSGFDDLENRPLYSAGSFFENDILVQTTAPELAVDANDATAEEVETPMPRRVHFADSGDSSDSEKTSEDELMSDFLLQENLDPDLRRMIENDSDAPKHLRNRNDLFDTNEYYELPGNIYHVESSSEVGSSSGYECMLN